jgi:hypothetical protein
MTQSFLVAFIMFTLLYLALLGTSSITGVSHTLLCSIVFGVFTFALFKHVADKD